VVQLLVNVDVDDLEKAIEFYRSALGLTLKRRLYNDTVAEMVGASSPICLLKKPVGSAASATLTTQRDYGRHWTPVHLDVAVDDLGLAVERALAAGAIVESDLQTYEWGRIAFMADPFGHGFCLPEFRDGGYEAA
jgi:predicted enzyme related to lactoylglutathione lyase